MSAATTVINGVGYFVFNVGEHSLMVRGPVTTPVERITFRSHVVRKTRPLCDDCRVGLHDMVDVALEANCEGPVYG